MRFQINGNDIEFVEHYKHLGHIINSAFDDNEDIADKRAAFIGQANNILCYFGKPSSEVKQHLFNSYCIRPLHAARTVPQFFAAYLRHELSHIKFFSALCLLYA